MKKDMKPGYLLKITTWENDADNYNTVEYSGLTVDQVSFYIEIVNLFTSCNSNDRGFGNEYVKDGTEFIDKAIDKIVTKYKESGMLIPEYWDKLHITDYEYGSKYSAAIYNMIGIWNEGEYYRVFDSFEVFYIPGGIQNVTEQFNGKT